MEPGNGKRCMMIAKCERCGDLYAAGSEELACEPHPLCWECAKILRRAGTLEHSRRKCAGRHEFDYEWYLLDQWSDR